MDINAIKKQEDKKVMLQEIIDKLNLREIYLPCSAKEIFVTSTKVNRPGLHFVGYFDYFDPTRIQIIGKSEYSYLLKMEASDRDKILDSFFALRPAVVMVTQHLTDYEEILAKSKQYGVPLLGINIETGDFTSRLISFLNVKMAPTITIPGGLMEVYGEGVMILGESGIGKSEASVELMKRGHRLVADDVVEITKVSYDTLMGTSPENIRHFLEIRGIGIINARQLFGLGAVKIKKSIDLIIKLEKWDSSKVYDRVGMKKTYTKILNTKIPMITLPIRAGRSIAVIIEAAAMNHRQNKMGYSAPEQLLKKLGYTEDFEDNAVDFTLDINKVF